MHIDPALPKYLVDVYFKKAKSSIYLKNLLYYSNWKILSYFFFFSDIQLNNRGKNYRLCKIVKGESWAERMFRCPHHDDYIEGLYIG
jgi:hypothetical protein